MTYVGQEPSQGDDQPTLVSCPHNHVLRLNFLDVSNLSSDLHLIL